MSVSHDKNEYYIIPVSHTKRINTAINRNTQQHTTTHWNVIRIIYIQIILITFLCVAVCCSVLQCVAVCCSVLQCPFLVCHTDHSCWHSPTAMQCVTMRCSVVQCGAVCCIVHSWRVMWVTRASAHTQLSSVLQCIAVHRSLLQSIAVYCSADSWRVTRVTVLALTHCYSISQRTNPCVYAQKHNVSGRILCAWKNGTYVCMNTCTCIYICLMGIHIHIFD